MACRVSVEKSGDKLIGVLLYIICHFTLVAFKFYVFDFHHSDNHVSWCVPPWVYTAGDSLCFLDVVDCFLSHIGEVFSCSVQFSHSDVSNSLWLHGLQHARLPCPSPTPGACSNSCLSSWWCHPTMSSSATSFSSCPQSFTASESFPMSQLFAWGGQSTGVSALASFLPKKSQEWSPSEWTGWISFQSKGLSRVFSNSTVQKHQFFGIQLSLCSNSHIHTWLLEKPPAKKCLCLLICCLGSS